MIDAPTATTEADLTPGSRARKLAEILAEHYEAEDPAASLTDLLANARHFADAHGLSFAEMDAIAHGHYAAEIVERADAPDLLRFVSEVARIVKASGANLCSTATEAERSSFISGILEAWNNGGCYAIAQATGAAS